MIWRIKGWDIKITSKRVDSLKQIKACSKLLSASKMVFNAKDVFKKIQPITKNVRFMYNFDPKLTPIMFSLSKVSMFHCICTLLYLNKIIFYNYLHISYEICCVLDQKSLLTKDRCQCSGKLLVQLLK